MLLPAFSGNGIISETINEVMNWFQRNALALSRNNINPNNLGSARFYKTVYKRSSLKRMNFMKDAFGQCNLFQIKQIITLYSFTILHN
jgi:hypothetical protein